MTMSVNQPLLQGFRTSYNLRGVIAAKRSLTSAEINALDQRQSTLSDTATAYHNLHYQAQLTAIAEETLHITSEERRIVIARVEQGDVADVELYRVEAAALEAKSQLLSAQNAQTSAAESLLLLLGMPPNTPLTLTPPDEFNFTDPLNIDQLIEYASTHNPNLNNLRIAEDLAESTLRDARHARLPELAGIGRYTLYGQEENFSAATDEMLSGDLRGWYLGAEATISLGNRTDRGSYEQSLAELQVAQVNREAAERGIEQQVRAQVRAIRSAQLQIELGEANLRAAEQTLTADQALRDAGRALEKDVLESIRDVRNSRTNLERSRTDYHLAIVALQRLKGEL